MIEDFLPYDEETSKAIVNAGRRMLRRMARRLGVKAQSYVHET